MSAGPEPPSEPNPAPIADDELAELALAADPDTAVAPGAVCLWELAGWDRHPLLPAWYMPAPMPGRSSTRRQRWVISLVVASFLLLNAYGLCSTYGTVGFD